VPSNYCFACSAFDLDRIFLFVRGELILEMIHESEDDFLELEAACQDPHLLPEFLEVNTPHYLFLQKLHLFISTGSSSKSQIMP